MIKVPLKLLGQAPNWSVPPKLSLFKAESAPELFDNIPISIQFQINLLVVNI